jgi:hypothetical protein
MGVPYTFAGQAEPIPLAELDADFAFLSTGSLALLTDTSVTANLITVAPPPGSVITAYSTGLTLSILVANTTTSTTPTINFNGLGAKTVINANGTALTAGQIISGQLINVVYDGTNFRLMSQSVPNVATLINYTAPFSGGVTETVAAKLAQTVSVIDFGADPTGTADSTAAFTNAGATGRLIYASAGTYKINSTSGAITIAGGGIIGDGAYQTQILDTSTTSNNTFSYTGALAGVFENFQISPATTKSGGYAITVGPISGEVSGMRFLQIIVNGMPNCIYFVRASLWSVIGCNFYSFTGNGLLVDNQNAGDSGDSVVLGCQFDSNNTSAFGIQQVSSGGLKIVGNKFNNNSVGYLLNLGNIAGGTSTSDLLISANSFENSANSDIQLQRQSGASSTFANVNIAGNQFLMAATGGSCVFSNDSSGFLSTVNVTSNTLTVTGSGAVGILFNFVTNFLLSDNVMQGSGGTSTGIICGVNSVSGRIGLNKIRGFAISINASTGVSISKSDIQSGTVTVTTSTGYGSALFAGTNSVTFTTAYDADVSFNITDVIVAPDSTGTGAVSAYVTGVSNTGFSVEAIGITNGGACVINWESKGIL